MRSSTFTQERRCTTCAYPVSVCRCDAGDSQEPEPVRVPVTRPTIQARAAELAPKTAKPSSVLPPALSEIREKMRRGETVPLTGPGSLAEALKTTSETVKPGTSFKVTDPRLHVALVKALPPASIVREKPEPIVPDVRALFEESAPNGGRMGDLIMDGILNATQQRLAL